jgi:hypothetical protein
MLRKILWATTLVLTASDLGVVLPGSHKSALDDAFSSYAYIIHCRESSPTRLLDLLDDNSFTLNSQCPKCLAATRQTVSARVRFSTHV